MFGFGLPEMGIVLVIAVLFLGPSKLPHLGKSLGGAINNFRSSVAEKGDVGSNVNNELK